MPSTGTPSAKKPRKEMHHSKTRDEHGVHSTEHSTGGDETHLKTSHASLDRVVTLNVGGSLITTLASTLRATPSRFTEWLDQDFRGFPRDAEGYPFLDRDKVNFKHVLNYMRGYGLPAKSEDLVLLAEDAVFYNVSSLKTEIGMHPPSMWRFNSGPGVQEDGTEFSTADILGLCGSEPLSVKQTHTITFRVDKCELVSIGVIATKEVREDVQLHRQKHSLSYCNTGELVRYFAEEPFYSSGEPYKSHDSVSVKVRFVPADGAAAPATAEVAGPAADSAAMDNEELMVTPREPQGAVSSETVDEQKIPSAPEALATAMKPLDACDAMVTFSKGGKIIFEERWSSPVPPIQFAVSMQGASAVMITDAMSIEDDAAHLLDPESGSLFHQGEGELMEEGFVPLPSTPSLGASQAAPSL